MIKLFTRLLVAFLLIGSYGLQAQDFKVLVFHKTNGFRHTGAIDASIDMIQDLGNSNGWKMIESRDASKFNDDTLATYDVVVWSCTSGGDLLSDDEQDAFESFIRDGKGFVGIHAASDTYRDGDWLWYNELVGAIVQTSPNHTKNNLSGIMDMVGTHEIVDHIGATWEKKEEWYYWERNGGWLYPGNKVLLEVRSTGSNSYDEVRPTTWYKEYDGGRSFYTALGHEAFNYNQEGNFKEMIKKAILWGANKLDIVDNCPNDEDKTNPGQCGCGVEDVDSDKDGLADCNDLCPNDPNKTEPGLCGCGIIDEGNCGNPYDIPGRIEGEAFSNSVGGPRAEDAGTNGNLGNARDASYVEYQVNLTSSALYEFTVSASASNSSGGTIDFSIDGQSVGDLEITATGGWNNYTDFSTELNIPFTGVKTLRLDFNTSNTYVGNFDYMDFEVISIVGIEEEESTTSDLYPNPSENIIQISNYNSYNTASIYGNYGRLVMELDEVNESINISNLGKGFYTIVFKGTERSTSMRFTKF